MVNAPVEVPPVLDAALAGAGCEEEGAAATVTVPPWSVIVILPKFTPPTVNPTGAAVSALVPVETGEAATGAVGGVPAPGAAGEDAAGAVDDVPVPGDAAGAVAAGGELTVINPPPKLVWPAPPAAPAAEEVVVGLDVVVACCCVVCVVVRTVVAAVVATMEPELVLIAAGIIVSVPLAKVIV